MKAIERMGMRVAVVAAWMVQSVAIFEAQGAASNDDFNAALVVSGSTGSVSTDNTGATKQPAEPDHADDPGGRSLWFRWTAPSSGQFGFNTLGSAIDTLLAVYTGTTLGNLNLVASNDDARLDHTSAVSIQAVAGVTYRIAVDGYQGETGAVTLAWGPEVNPANDSFASAQVISGVSGSLAGTNTGATSEAGEPQHAGAVGGRSVWYRWTAPSTNQIVITTAGSSFDTILAVYTGNNVNGLTEVASNDEYEADHTSTVIFTPVAGTIYSIVVDGFSGGMGPLMLNWEPFVNIANVSFAALHHFTNDANGFWPEAPVIAAGNRLYGTTVTHNPGAGTVFTMNTDGSGFGTLKSFNGGPDGGNPMAELIASGDTLYGSLESGGTNFRGTLFSIKTNGADFKVLHTFTTTYGVLATNNDGAGPRAGLTRSGQTLFGVTQVGGHFGAGTVFSLNANGTGFTTLHHFPALEGIGETNSQGGKPVVTLVLGGDTLYGAAVSGGAFGYGTIYSLKTNGTSFTVLHQFDGEDGLLPRALILSGNRLYGAAADSVFALNTNGGGFTNLARFLSAGSGSPYGQIALSGDRLYGSTMSGGTSGLGTVYTVRTNGTGFITLHQFPPRSNPSNTNTDGAIPRGLIVSGNAIYGTAEVGGYWDYGTVFRITFPQPVLTITRLGSDAVLKWPASPGGFTLETSSNLLSSPTAWIPSSAAPAVVGGQNVVTNTTSNAMEFYRLRQ